MKIIEMLKENSFDVKGYCTKMFFMNDSIIVVMGRNSKHSISSAYEIKLYEGDSEDAAVEAFMKNENG